MLQRLIRPTFTTDWKSMYNYVGNLNLRDHKIHWLHQLWNIMVIPMASRGALLLVNPSENLVGDAHYLA